MKIFKKILLTTTLFSTTSVLLADTKIDKNTINIFNDKTLIANSYFDIDESDTLKITVIGTKTERSILDLPGSVNVYDLDALESSGASNWRQLFSNDPSLGSQFFMRSDFYRPYAKGDSGNINIRGLEGNRILTQIDGITIPRFSYGTNTFSASRQNFVELNNLGKVEILKGAGSSLYGSDALGGVVTLRTLRPDDLLKEDQKSATRITGNYDSANKSYKPNLKYAFRDNDIEGIFSITYENSEELNRKTLPTYINQMDADNVSYFGKFVKKINDEKEFSVSLEKLYKNNTTNHNANLIDDTYGSRNNYTSSKDLTDSDTTRLKFNYVYNSSIDKFIDNFKGDFYLSALKYENEWQTRGGGRSGTTNVNEITTLDQNTIGTNLQFTNKISNKKYDQQITFGFEGSFFDGDRIQNEITLGGSTETFRRNPESDVVKYAAYIQNEISRGKFDFIPGIRYDSTKIDAHSSQPWYDSGSDYLLDKAGSVGEPHDIKESSISPSLRILYRINESSNIFGKYARGFRTPSWEEVNSSHINVYSMGPLGFGAYTTVGNANLKAETSDNFEIGIKSNNDKFDYSFAAFYQKFKNFLEQSAEDGTTEVATSVGTLDATVYRTKNVSDAHIWGLEANSVYYFNNKEDGGLSLSNSIAFQVGEDDTNDEPLQTINPFTLVSNLKYIFPNKKLALNLTNTYTGVPTPNSNYKKGYPISNTTYSNSAFIPDAYLVTDLQLAYKVNNSFSTNLGIYNIFDTTYYKWSDLRSNGRNGSDDKYYQRYAQPGTSIQAGFSWKF